MLTGPQIDQSYVAVSDLKECGHWNWLRRFQDPGAGS